MALHPGRHNLDRKVAKGNISRNRDPRCTILDRGEEKEEEEEEEDEDDQENEGRDT
ncbi:hypothetical protein YC2023_036566 [Brassica napus]